MEKVCRVCACVKGASEFSKDSSKVDGLRSICRACDYEKRKARNNQDTQARKRSLKNWRREHPDYMRNWRAQNTKNYNNGLTVIPEQKKCPHCNKIKPSDQFGMNRSSRDGLAGWCISCTDAYLAGREDFTWRRIGD